MTGSSPGSPNGRTGGHPTSIRELGLSAEEEAASREIIRKWNTDPAHPYTEADYIRNYLAAQEEVDHFGQ